MVAVAATAVGCGNDPCDLSAETCTISATVSTLEVPAGSEDEDVCQSVTLDNPTELWVRSIRQVNTGAYHHANWFFVPDDQFDLPDGAWSCAEQNFSELTAAILGGYLFAMSTQSREETQVIPAGGAIRIPPYSRLIGASHLLNAGDEAVLTELEITLQTVPPADVAAKLAPARITYHDLNIDAGARSSFSTECMIADSYRDVMGTAFQMELFYGLSHYHDLGTYARVEIVGGPRDGEVLFRADGVGENYGRPFDPPVNLAAEGAEGIRFTCGFDNPRPELVDWGIGDQEMCVLALMHRSDMAWDGIVDDGAGQRLGVAPDGEIEYAGPCSILGIPWDHDKPGGPGR